MAKYMKYAPEFRIKIKGENIPADLRNSITSVNYQDGMEGADRVEITVVDEKLRWMDHQLLDADNELTLAIGYAPDPLEEVFFGEITGINASFSSGAPTLTIVAHDFLNRLTQGTKHRVFAIRIPSYGNIPLPDPAAAGIVAGINKLIPLIDPVGAALSVLTSLAAASDSQEGQIPVRRQLGQSDFDFLSQIARENGWEMYIDHSLAPHGYMLRFSFLIQDYTPNLTLKWGESLMNFTPRISTVGQVIGVSVHVWVAAIKMEFLISLSWDFDRATFNLIVYPGVDQLSNILGEEIASQTLTIMDQPVTLSNAPRIILSELLPRLNRRLTGSGSTIGDTRIRAGEVINLEGLGETFSGLYRVTSANHTIDGNGYRTNFEVRKEIWFGSVPIPKGIGGLFQVQGQSIG